MAQPIEQQPRGEASDARLWAARLLRLLNPLFLLLALVFIGLLLRAHWQEFTVQAWRLHAGWLVFALGAMLASWAVEIGLWRYLLDKLGGRLSYAEAMRIWFLSALVRYVPGNIWQPLGMTVLCARHGIQAEAVLLSIGLLQVVALLSVAPLGAFYSFLGGNWGGMTAAMGVGLQGIAFLALALLLFFVASPAWLFRLLNWGLAKIGRPPLAVTLSSRQLLSLLLISSLFWLLWGLSFAGFVLAFIPLPQQQIGQIFLFSIAAFPVAYAIGYLSFITPSGLAVREGALYLLLAPVLGGGPTTVAALAIRLWQVILEVAVAGAVVVGASRR